MVAGYDSFNERIEEVYRAMTSYLGFRLREPLTLRQFTIAADSLGQGCGLRDRFDNAHMDGILLPTGQQGELQEWTLFAIGFEALVAQILRLDPDWKGNDYRRGPGRGPGSSSDWTPMTARGESGGGGTAVAESVAPSGLPTRWRGHAPS